MSCSVIILCGTTQLDEWDSGMDRQGLKDLNKFKSTLPSHLAEQMHFMDEYSYYDGDGSLSGFADLNPEDYNLVYEAWENFWANY